MSTKAIDYNIILKRDGQTQRQRMPQLLDPSRVPIDARTKEDFFRYMKSLAGEIKYYDLDANGNSIITNGNWEDFFSLSENERHELAAKASLPPHLALWNAFLELYEKPKQLLNGVTKRHLDFYYSEVLNLRKNAPTADRAHVIFELKKNAEETLLPSGTVLLAGKDNAKKDLHYKLTHDIIVNRSKVAQLKSLYVNPENKNLIHYAPVANSADGLGGELNKANPRWNAFGNPGLPKAQAGFCFASGILKMKEGDRTITIKLSLRNLPDNALKSALVANLFKTSITGEKGWIGFKTVSPVITSSDSGIFDLQFSILLTKAEPAVSNYDRTIHGNDFDTANPILQILINNEKSDFGFKDFADAELLDATIEVRVEGIKDLQLENDFGVLNEKKAFLPFGPMPEVNSNFYVGNEEAFSKRLKEFSFDVEWRNIPATRMDTYFAGYGGANANSNFTAVSAFKDGFNWQEKTKSIPIFNVSNAQVSTVWTFQNPDFAVKLPIFYLPNISVKASVVPGQNLQQKLSSKLSHLVPAFASLKLKSAASMQILYRPTIQALANAYKDIRKGAFTLRLKHGFFFKEYPKKYTKAILDGIQNKTSPDLPNEPFSPEIQSIRMNYTATTAKTNFGGRSLNDYIDEEIEFFHFGAFGQMREHAYARSQYAFLNNSNVKLLPAYNNEGEFYIGLTGLYPDQEACILFQVAEGSADPNTEKADLQWSILCDNYWKDLSNEDLIFDSTNDLLTSGIIKFIIPKEATTSNTILPDGLLWLRASMAQSSDSVCNLIDVQTNAAIALFEDQGNDPSHFGSSLPAGTINKMKVEAGAIKEIRQPYASFGGKSQENDGGYYTRISERLRHKERSIALWDYERLILQHFPTIHKAKCINHAGDSSYYQSGNVMIVVIPDLTNQNAANPLQPAVDKNTLDEIKTFLSKRSTSWAEFRVSNPMYEPVKISVGIKLKRGYEFSNYQKILDRKLQEFLSPWVTTQGGEIYFGGKFTKSMIVKFLENFEFVDYLTDLRLIHYSSRSRSENNPAYVEATTPASVLVSHDHHEIVSV